MTRLEETEALRARTDVHYNCCQSVLVPFADLCGLDKETAFRISSSILDLEGLTRVVVTHSLDEALLSRYDGILVLHHGRVVETGQFQELMDRKGLFYSLYTVAQ